MNMRYTTDQMREYAGPAPESGDFGVKTAVREAADEIDRLRAIEARAKVLVAFIRDEGPSAKEWKAISDVTGELGNLLNIPTE